MAGLGVTLPKVGVTAGVDGRSPIVLHAAVGLVRRVTLLGTVRVVLFADIVVNHSLRARCGQEQRTDCHHLVSTIVHVPHRDLSGYAIRRGLEMCM